MTSTDFIEESYANPTSTSLCFISSLVENRKKHTLMPMLNFIQGVVSKYVVLCLRWIHETQAYP